MNLIIQEMKCKKNQQHKNLLKNKARKMHRVHEKAINQKPQGLMNKNLDFFLFISAQ